MHRVLDAFDVAVTTHASYFYAIKNFGNIQVLTQGDIVWYVLVGDLIVSILH